MKLYFHAVVISTSSDRNRPILRRAGASDERLWVLVCALGSTQGLQVLYVAAKPRRVGQNLCRKQLASTFLDPKIAKESISAIESCHRSRADALQDHFQPTSIYNCQQPDHACINFCLSHSENSVQMHACMICRSEFSPEWLNQRMHGHRPARIRSGGCMTGNRKIMQK